MHSLQESSARLPVLDLSECETLPPPTPPPSHPLTLLALLSRETTSGRFIPQIDGLRFVAIAMVILFHLRAYLLAKSLFYASFSHRDWIGQASAFGFHGVELFFVISGFILGLPFAAQHLQGAARVDLRKYYLRRLTRLEPPYVVTAVALFSIAALLQTRNAAALLPHLGASIFYIHNLIYRSASSVIGVAWSLEIEVQFYVLVPVLTMFLAVRGKWRRRVSLVALGAAALLAQMLYIEHSSRLSLSILGYLQFFLVGLLLADVFISDWKGNPSTNFYWDAVSLVGWPLMFLMFRVDNLTHWLFAPSIFVLYCAAFRGRVGRKLFSLPWISAIGGMCYSIYLIHYEVISAVGRVTSRIATAAPSWVYFLIQTALVGSAIFIVCGLYFVVLEKPCMRPDWPQRVWRILKSRVPSSRRLVRFEAAD